MITLHNIFTRRGLFSKTILLHACCWIAFISYEIGFVFFATGSFGRPFAYLFYYTVNICFFYAVVDRLSRTFSQKDPAYLEGLTGIVITLCCFILIKAAADYIDLPKGSAYEKRIQQVWRQLPFDLWRFVFFVILSVVYWSSRHVSYFRDRAFAAERLQLLHLKEKAELEARLATAKNAFLQQQLNPHMLFNTLNFIHNKVQHSSPDAGDCVLLLSEIMRFGLEANGYDNEVPLDQEAAQLRNLITINQYRFENKLFLSAEFDGELSGFLIVPLVLLTLTENVFKHGHLQNKEQPARLCLSVSEERQLTFYTRNLKKSKSNYKQLRSTGIENVRTRLELAYPGKHELNVTETANLFELKLTLQL
jgi:two-component system LytT family sensor kinase